MEHFQFGKQIDKFLDMATLFVCIHGQKLINMRIDAFLFDFFDYGSLDSGLSLLCRCK